MVRLNEQFRLQWRRIPDTSSNKMMQLIIVARRKSLCHWLNALAFTRANQPCHVERTHPPPRLVIQAIQKRLQPTSKLALPIRRCPPHGRPSKSRPPMNHRKTDLGIPDRLSPVRICQSSARWLAGKIRCSHEFLFPIVIFERDFPNLGRFRKVSGGTKPSKSGQEPIRGY